MKPIARLPVNGDYIPIREDFCSVCDDDNVLVVIEVDGMENGIAYPIALCPMCYSRMRRELEKLNLGQ